MLPELGTPFTIHQLTATHLLVLEKNSILSFLEANKFRERTGGKVILFNCHSNPTFTARADLAQIALDPNIQFHLLFDGNVSGFEMVHTLVFGSLSGSWRESQPTVPHAKWIGVFNSQLAPGTHAGIDIDGCQRNHLETMKERPRIEDPPIGQVGNLNTGQLLSREIKHLLSTGQAFEIEDNCEPAATFMNNLMDAMGLQPFPVPKRPVNLVNLLFDRQVNLYFWFPGSPEV